MVCVKIISKKVMFQFTGRIPPRIPPRGSHL